MQQNQKLNPPILKIIWGALLFSQLFYLFVLKMIVSQNTEPLPDVDKNFVTILSSVAIVDFFAAVYLFKFLIKKAKQRIGDVSKIDSQTLVQHYFAPFIVRLALFESVAVIGFTLAFTNRAIEMYYPYLVVSIIAFISNFPTDEKMKSAFK